MESAKQPHLTTNQGRIFTKAQINGQTYYSIQNKQVKKRNSYTVSFTTSSSISYGLIKYYLCVNGCSLAVVGYLECLYTGPTETFLSGIMTPEYDKILFEDYFTCKVMKKQFIFVNHIKSKLCNISNNKWILITSLVNDVEIE